MAIPYLAKILNSLIAYFFFFCRAACETFPGGSAGKKIPLQCRRPGFDPWVGKIPWRRERLSTLVVWPGEFPGLYSPWGCKELDTTERLSDETWLAPQPEVKLVPLAVETQES